MSRKCSICILLLSFLFFFFLFFFFFFFARARHYINVLDHNKKGGINVIMTTSFIYQFMPSGLFYLNYLDRSISYIRGLSAWLSLLLCVVEISELNANSVDPDQTPCSAASDQGQNHLPMPLLWDARLKWLINYIFPFITKTYLYNFYPLKPHFYIVKLGFTGVYIIFLISAQKHRLWVLVRTASPRRF